MSLLDHPPHALTVQPRSPAPSPHGVELADCGVPASVPGILRSLSSQESDTDGISVTGLKRFTCRDWPGDAHSLVTLADGTQWEPVGQPLRYDGSPLTAHWEVTLRRRT